MRLNLRHFLFLLGLFAVSVAIANRTPLNPALETAVSAALSPKSSGHRLTDAVRSELHAGTAAAHSATLTRLPDGTLLAYWFAGTREGASDVQIFGARYRDGRWSAAEPIVSVALTMTDEWRFIRKLGNPVAVVDAQGRLHLFFVSVSVGGWATSNLNQMTSADGGLTWGRAHVLVTTPFFNLSTLARTPAIHRKDGGFDLPVYHELARKMPELLRFNADGRFVQKVRISTCGALLQPAAVALNEREILVLLRDGGPERRLKSLRSLDAGQTWSASINTDQTNPDAAIALARLSDGTLLLAYNPRADGRSELALATSVNGIDWAPRRTVELELDGEFSYPTLLIANDEDIHLVYTWQRRHIRHIHFNRAWLNFQTGGQP